MFVVSAADRSRAELTVDVPIPNRLFVSSQKKLAGLDDWVSLLPSEKTTPPFWKVVVAVPPEERESAEASVSTPALLKVEVAVSPIAKYPADNVVEDAFWNCWSAVQLFVWERFKSKLMVPDVVIGLVPPSERVEFGEEAWTEVTVPFVAPMQVPFLAKQPFAILIPFAKVLVADVPVIFKYVVDSPEAMVDVAFDRMVVVAVPF